MGAITVIKGWSANCMLCSMFILYIPVLLCSFHVYCADRVSLRYGEWIRDNEETLVSPGRKFELGFFGPTGSSRVRRYVGIWYTSDKQIIVWVANRDSPLFNTTGAFRFKPDGSLAVLDTSSGKVHWYTELGSHHWCDPCTTTDRILNLTDSGNLVFFNNEKSLWESFNDPTDTFLPNMTMKRYMKLTSWRDRDDPGTGNFTFMLDTVGNSNAQIVNKEGKIYWKSLENGGYYSIITTTEGQNSYDFENARLVMNFSGKLEYWEQSTFGTWSLYDVKPSDNCSVYNFCGKFGSCNLNNNKLPCKCLPGFKPHVPQKWYSGDFSDGCTRYSMSCGESGDTFLNLKMMNIGGRPKQIQRVGNETECKELCLKNCDCKSYSYITNQDSEMACGIWMQELVNLQEEYVEGYNLSIRVAISAIEPTVQNCEPCGTNMIPYPLSTSSNCGDPMYFSFNCNSSGQISFKAPSGTYRVTNIDQNTSKFFIQVKDVGSLRLNQSLPFNLTTPRNSSSNVSSRVTDDVEIVWEPPLEPICNSSADCKDWPHSTCKSAIAKVVEGPCDSLVIPDGAALSAFQYFENVRNFLVAVEELGLPTFEASDLEQGGKSARIVNCVLAIKSYSEWKEGGRNGSWKPGANLKAPICVKSFVRKNSEPFMNSFSRASSLNEKSLQSLSSDLSSYNDIGHDLNEAGSSRSLNMLVREVLSNKKQEEIPIIVESMLNKVMEEFNRRLESQNEQMKTTAKDMAESGPDDSLSKTSDDIKVEEKSGMQYKEEESYDRKYDLDEGSKSRLLKQHMFVEQQQRDILELKHILHSTKAGMQFLQAKYEEEFNNLGKHLHGLAHAASGYQRVLEENRKLYNQVQDLKGNIRVYCRVRPFLPGQPNRSSSVDNIEEGNISIIAPLKYSREGKKSFTFNKVFGPSATQEEVFSDTQPLIRSVLDGYNVCIFAYGQTGSGKTYTMSGPRELTEEGQGVNYRALGDLFLLSEQRKDTICYDISVQMLEIYNEQVKDLLVSDGVNKRLEIRNSSQNGINVPEANLVPVSTTSDVINLMNLGHKNRSVGATAMNDRSSRSHSCLTVHVQGRDLTSGSILRGCMHLVDLAGSERVDKSEVTGDRLKEAQHINKSLSALGDVIYSLAQKSSHVPYRNSKLTQLLQDSLGGQAKTLMFVHISPEPEALGETISTLKFAERVSTVELGAARVNKDGSEVKELKEQIASLKAALLRKEGETESIRSSQSSPERSKMKSCGSSPSHPSWRSFGDFSAGRRQAMDNVGNLEARSNSKLKPKRCSLDFHDMLMSSTPWPLVGSPTLIGKEDDKDFVSGEWVDKIMVNKHDSASGDETLVRHWEVDNRLSPEMFGESYISAPSKIYPEQALNKLTVNKKDIQDYDVPSSRYEVATDDSDELEAATSDSSEPDMHWQQNLPKLTNISNGLKSKPKKTNPKPAKNQESRSLIPSLIPAPSRIKPPNGISQALQKPGRLAVRTDGKRKTGNAK